MAAGVAIAAALALGVAGCTSGAAHPTQPTATGSAERVGTLYAPPSSAPSPGALYARAVRLKSGVMLATFEQYTAEKPVFPIYRSSDNGAHWKRFSTIADTENGWGLRYQPFLYQLPSAIGSLTAGTIVAAGNSIPNNLSKTQLDLYASSDQGATWRFVSTFASGGRAIPNNGETPVWEPFLVDTDGRLIAYYSDQRDPRHGQKLVHQTSTDGIHWSPVVTDVAYAGPAARPGMPTVTHMGNGMWAMTYEYGGAPEGDFAAYIRFASDPLKFSAASGSAIRAGNTYGFSSPYVLWVPGGAHGTLIVSTGNAPFLFVNRDYGASDAWTTVSSAVPQGYTRALVSLGNNGRVFGISAGAIGAQHNTVRYATDTVGK